MEKQRKCKYCGQEVNIKTGFSNWKNLLRKPTLDEWITLFIIVMVILSSYAYRNDINKLNEYYTKGDYCNQQLELPPQELGGNENQQEEFFDFGDGFRNDG